MQSARWSIIAFVSLAISVSAKHYDTQYVINMCNEKRRKNHNAVNNIHDGRMDDEAWHAAGGSFLLNAAPGMGGAVAGFVGDPLILLGWMKECKDQYGDCVDTQSDLNDVLTNATANIHGTFGLPLGLMKKMEESGDNWVMLGSRIGKGILKAVIGGTMWYLKKKAVQQAVGEAAFWGHASEAVDDMFHEDTYMRMWDRNEESAEIRQYEERRMMEDRMTQTLEREELEAVAKREAIQRVTDSTVGWLPFIGSVICGTVSLGFMRQSCCELNDQFRDGYNTSIDQFWDLVIKQATT